MRSTVDTCDTPGLNSAAQRAVGPIVATNLEGDAAQYEAILAERARTLASRNARSDRAENGTPSLMLSVGEGSYALPLTAIAAIIQNRSLSLVPGARPELRGTLYEKGAIWAVFDLCALMGRSTSSSEKEAFILLLRDPRHVGLRVDDVSHVARVRDQDVLPLGADDARAAQGIVRGATANAIVVLNPSTQWQHPAISEEH